MSSELRSPRDGIHIEVQGQFITRDSEMTLHLFLDHFTYDTGLQLRFRLVEDDDPEALSPAIDVEFAEPGLSFRHLATLSNAITRERGFHFRVEAFNDISANQRILLWNEQVALQSQVRQRKDKILEGNADFDSADSGVVFFRWGQGFRWGLNMTDMRILTFRREVPFVFP
jgi:hypothetical protein